MLNMLLAISKLSTLAWPWDGRRSTSLYVLPSHYHLPYPPVHTFCRPRLNFYLLLILHPFTNLAGIRLEL